MRPTYEDRGGFIHIVFKRKSFTLSDDTKNDTKKLSIKSVTDRQKQIITILRNNNKTSTEELSAMFSVSKSTILRDIKELNAQGVLAWVGSQKGGHWEIKE